MTGKTRAKGAAATRTCAWKSRDMASPEFLQGFRDPGELLVNGRHLILQCLDLRSGEGIDRADRDAAGGTLPSISLRLSPSGVNSASSKLCPAHLLQVEMAIRRSRTHSLILYFGCHLANLHILTKS